MDYGGPWGWNRVHPCYVYRKIIPDLHSFEGMKWQQMYVAQSKGSAHTIHGSKLHRVARARLRTLGIDEDQNFVSVKLEHKLVRLWGIRNGCLNILWWDPGHEVYPSRANKSEARRERGIVDRPPPPHDRCPYSPGERQGGMYCAACWTQNGDA